MRSTDKIWLHGESAVRFSGVSKVFYQWQHESGLGQMVRHWLRPKRREIRALDNVSLTVKPGEFVAYAGPNGAGKSTSIKIVAGMLAPESGGVQVFGADPGRMRIQLMRHMGVVFGNRTELWWDHPVEASFDWKRAVWDIPKDQYKKTREMLVEILDIGNLMQTFARELSLGQRMRCDLAMAFLHNPALILLDEPTLGLDVLAKRQMIAFLKHLNRQMGATLLVTSHDMDDLEEMAQRIVMIAKGRIAFDGDFTDLRAYMGGGREIVITTQSKIPPRLALAAHVGSEGSQHTYRMESGDVRALLREISEVGEVRDVAFQSAPLEQTIAKLYERWASR